MLIKVEAIINEEKFEDVKEALNAIHVNGITVSQVMGCGTQRGLKRYVRGSEVEINLLPKIKLEIVVSSEKWEEKVIDTIQKQLTLEMSVTEKFSAMNSAPLPRFVRMKRMNMRSGVMSSGRNMHEIQRQKKTCNRNLPEK